MGEVDNEAKGALEKLKREFQHYVPASKRGFIAVLLTGCIAIFTLTATGFFQGMGGALLQRLTASNRGLSIAGISLVNPVSEYVAPTDIQRAAKQFSARDAKGEWKSQSYPNEAAEWVSPGTFVSPSECIRPSENFYKRSFYLVEQRALADFAQQPEFEKNYIQLAMGRSATDAERNEWVDSVAKLKPLKRPLKWAPIKLEISLNNTSSKPLLVRSVGLKIYAYDIFAYPGGGEGGMLAEPLLSNGEAKLILPNFYDTVAAAALVKPEITIPSAGFGKFTLEMINHSGEGEMSIRFAGKLTVTGVVDGKEVSTTSGMFCVIRALTIWDFDQSSQ